jgi:hypothetical protein
MTDGNDPAYPTIGIQNNEESGLVGGLSKREHFAVKAEGFDADATAEFVAKCLGWSVPTFPEEMGRAKVKTIVVDLDGTLANIDHRVHLVKRDKPEWDQFYAACHKDSVNQWCAEIMSAFHSQNFKVLIVSARRDTEKAKTLKWLDSNMVRYSQLIMLRKGDDNTPDTQLKKKWLNSYGKGDILFIVDDRQKVVDMWRAEGMTCLQCYAWKEHE